MLQGNLWRRVLAPIRSQMPLLPEEVLVAAAAPRSVPTPMAANNAPSSDDVG
jgi:hypothetical protein